LIAYEKETWELIKRKDLKSFANYLADDFYDIFPDGKERTRSKLLKFLSEADLKNFQLSDFRVTLLNEDVAIVTYQADARAIIEGREIWMHNAVTSGWAKRGGRWLNVSAVASPRCSKTSPWGLDTREGFFKPTRAGARPTCVAARRASGT
jgi:ketosteroid isomerase-like protein